VHWPRVSGQNLKKNNFPVRAKIRISGYQTLATNGVYECLVHLGKLLTDLQIWGCELHKKAFGGRAPPGPAGGAIVLLQAP